MEKEKKYKCVVCGRIAKDSFEGSVVTRGNMSNFICYDCVSMLEEGEEEDNARK